MTTKALTVFFDKLAPLLLFLFSLAFLAAHLSNRPIFTRGEGREAMAVKSMYVEGNYILPLLDGETIPSKPPLFHWLASLTASVLGELNEFALRFPSALAGAGLLTLTFIFAAKYLSRNCAFLAVLILVSSFEYSRSATHARVDMCFAFSISLALFFLFRSIRASGNGGWMYLIVSALATALAVLAKGPSAIGIVILVYFVFLLLSRGIQGSSSPLSWQKCVSALIVTIGIAGTWYVLAYQQSGGEFLLKQIWQENITRILNVSGETALRGHVKPFYFSFLHLLLGFLPWSFLLPFLAVSLWRGGDGYRKRDQQFELFLISWFLVIVLAVTLSQSKRVVYLLPAYPALAILLSNALLPTYATQTTGERRSIRFAAVFLMASSVVLLLASLFGFTLLSEGGVARYLQYFQSTPKVETFILGAHVLLKQIWLSLLLLVCVAIAIGIGALAFWRLRPVYGSCLLASAILLLVFSYAASIYPAVADYRNSKELIAVADKALKEKDTPIEIFRANLYAERYYSDRPLPFVLTAGELIGRGGGLVLVERKNLELLQQTVGEVEILYRGKNIPVKSRSDLFLVRYHK